MRANFGPAITSITQSGMNAPVSSSKNNIWAWLTKLHKLAKGNIRKAPAAKVELIVTISAVMTVVFIASPVSLSSVIVFIFAVDEFCVDPEPEPDPDPDPEPDPDPDPEPDLDPEFEPKINY